MTLSDRVHCPECRGRLVAADAELRCFDCGRTIPLADGIVDLVTGRSPAAPPADRYHGVTREHGLLAAGLPVRIKAAAGGRWPVVLGDTISFGCGLGVMTRAIVTGDKPRSLLVIDTELSTLRACRAAIADREAGRSANFAALDASVSVIRDAVADTVIATVALSAVTDTRAFLTMVHRVLRIGGRALFVVPNRRYHHVACLAIAEGLTQRYARDGTWPERTATIFAWLGAMRRLLIDRKDPAFLATLDEKHLFDSDVLEDLAKEVGFATAEVLPLDPDLAGGDTFTRLCQDAGAPDEVAREFGPLAAAIGRPLLGLLKHQDTSAFSLLWLTKAAGPAVRIYTGRPAGPRVVYPGPDSALGGLTPRWSVELLARDTPDGVKVTVGGWCLCNIDALWVRISLDGVARNTPVWRPRPDVHEVLNRTQVWHRLNAICSGLDDDLLFADVHPSDQGCALRLEFVLAGDLIVTGPAPERLAMDQPTVIAH
jgi:ubiquinone/menaquinone biosynthesis C-methylase UbiE